MTVMSYGESSLLNVSDSSECFRASLPLPKHEIKSLEISCPSSLYLLNIPSKMVLHTVLALEDSVGMQFTDRFFSGFFL